MTGTVDRRFVLAGTVAAIAATVFGSRLPRSAKAAERAPKVHRVEIKRFKFKPKKLEIRPGDTITWINLDLVPHTATAKDKSWDTGKLRKGESKSIVITEPMTLAYFCRFHPNMKAQIRFSAGS